MCGYCLLQHLGWCRELFHTDQQSCSLPSSAPFLLLPPALQVSLTEGVYVLERNPGVYWESSHGSLLSVQGISPSRCCSGISHPSSLQNLTIKILAPALSRLVSIREGPCAVCLPFPLEPRQAAGPTVQTSDLNKCPERRLENWHSHALNSELLLGRRQAMSVGFSLCCLIKTREQGMGARAALHTELCTSSVLHTVLCSPSACSNLLNH